MLQLHVWGADSAVSVLSPECLASSWLVNSKLARQEFEIVTSSNTNISDIHKLPVLIDGNVKYQGYVAIARFIEGKNLSLLNSSLLNLNLTKIEYINQYNLYINVKNYEKFTRKQFQKYFPFPMMYNQPLKFYNNAQAQIKLLGLGTNKTSFFSLAGPQTEAVNDDYSDDDEERQIALSALHERNLLAKSQAKESLKETRNSLRCLHLLHEYLQCYVDVYKETHEGEFGYLFSEISSSELLLYAYIYSLTYEELPDQFVANYIKLKYGKMAEFIYQKVAEYNGELERANFRPPHAQEAPSLLNEIKYWTGLIKYWLPGHRSMYKTSMRPTK